MKPRLEATNAGDEAMEIIPAVDLKNGRCVRLYQGDYDKETVFSDDPVSMARRWQSHGATRLHVVDLDGAAEGEPRNLDAVERIVAAVDIPVQVGGGIRSIDTVEKLLGLGLARAILGTAAIDDPDLVEQSCRRFGEQVVIGVDARDGMVATRGWLEQSSERAGDLAAAMVARGARRLIYTDITRDGTLSGPNFEGVAELLSHVGVPVIAAGGISSIEHLVRLAESGVEGAIVGRAIYTGDMDLREAIQEITGNQQQRGRDYEV
jgi:phosphoribosylformimino-5-aminoimidazole carboxamide ribotide isomerase